MKATAEAAAAAEADSDDARAPMDGNDTSMDSPLLMGVDEVYGCHLWNYSSAGTVGIAAGAVTANSDSCVSWTRTADPLVARAPRMPPAVAPRTESSVLPSRAESFCLGARGRLQFVVHGTGGHASAPQGTVDAIVVAGE